MIMQMGGCKTRSMFDRWTVVDESDLGPSGRRRWPGSRRRPKVRALTARHECPKCLESRAVAEEVQSPTHSSSRSIPVPRESSWR